MTRNILAVLLIAIPACAQTLPTAAPVPATETAPATMPAATTTAPGDDVLPGARAILDLLEKRGGTLKDFYADVEYSVYQTKLDSTEASDGYIAYIKDAAGTRFSLRRTNMKVDGKIVKIKLENDILFDGEWLTLKDPVAKTYHRIQVAKPGAAISPLSLDGPLPMPIGQKTETVVRGFYVKLLPSKDPDQAILELIPRTKGRSDFSDLVITVDRKLELPIKLVSTSLSGDVTTIIFKDPKVNEGKATLLTITPPPAGAGWEVKIDPLK